MIAEGLTGWWKGRRVGGMKKLALVLLVGPLMAGCGGNEESADSDGNDSAKAPIVEKWDEWEANPEPYGGLEVLAKIREAKASNATELTLSLNQITDLTPLAGLKNLKQIIIYDNPDLTRTEIGKLKAALPNCVIRHNAKKL